METNMSKGAKTSLNSIGSLFGDTFKLYQDRFSVLTEIVLLPSLVMLLGYILIWLGSPWSLAGVIVIACGVIALIFSSLALVYSIHNNSDVDASYRATTKFFWPCIWIGILGALASLGGTVMLIIPGIWLALALSLRNYVLILENRKGIDALRQSKDYIKGYWWALLGRVILLAIVFVIISIILQVPFSLIGGKIGTDIASSIYLLLILPFASIFIYKIYENLRTLKPELHGAARAGNTFIKVSAIIGVVAAVVIILAAPSFVAAMQNYQHSNFNHWAYPSSNP